MIEKRPGGLIGVLNILAVSALLALELFTSALSPLAVVRILMIILLLDLMLYTYIHRKEDGGDSSKLIEKIYFDARTGLPNREKLRLDAVQNDSVIFLINIDSFKEVNDFYGNRVGDQIIQAMARRLSDIFSGSFARLFEGGTLYKLEADEFAFLFRFEMGEERIRRSAEVILETVNDIPFHVGETEITVSITLGIASVSGLFLSEQKSDRTPGILAQADMALKKAKETGQPFLIYTHTLDIHREYEENIRRTHQVKQSIRRDQVIPYYQPIINNRTGEIEKFECLMRIVDEEDRIIYPEQFLWISKRSRQYPALSRIMLRKVIREMKRTEYDYAFNISLEDMQNRGTVDFIRTILEVHHDAAPRICFEILESENIEGIPEVCEFIRMVKSFGCSTALDDFGTGYSNFSYILSLDLDYIKIDASIIRNLDRDENAVAIAETIIGFARRTGKKTVAEYVHSAEILELVKKMGVDYSQGYYLGKPRISSLPESQPEVTEEDSEDPAVLSSGLGSS